MGILNLFKNKKERPMNVYDKIDKGIIPYERELERSLIDLYESFISYKSSRLNIECDIKNIVADNDCCNYAIHHAIKYGYSLGNLYDSHKDVVKECMSEEFIRSQIEMTTTLLIPMATVKLRHIKIIFNKYDGGYFEEKLLCYTDDDMIKNSAISKSTYKKYTNEFSQEIKIEKDTWNENEYLEFIHILEKADELINSKKKYYNYDGFLIDENGNLIERDFFTPYKDRFVFDVNGLDKANSNKYVYMSDKYLAGEVSKEELVKSNVERALHFMHLYYNNDFNFAYKRHSVKKGVIVFEDIQKALGELYTQEQFVLDCIKEEPESEKLIRDYMDVSNYVWTVPFPDTLKVFDAKTGKVTLPDGRVV